ncbi:MAG: adenylate/guanylate cyclase domain-containing protein [Ignavibacteriales bacterium]|nr:adenylate/guanylate cyclase domain-containing protein [Ignavibacteriales bacterium]MCF8316790.1 adenylate/guanylate cyclase domain-containing protein [Ignavibacteriales bacterium]MCF8438094.1 adenylate/guanylate cyclase domain-containing protein [Ignavibacteriales bacterium]
MIFRLRSRSVLFKLLPGNVFVLLLLIFLLILFDLPFNTYDHKILDLFSRLSYEKDTGGKNSGRVVLLNITGETYEAFRSNYLPRTELAGLNKKLAELSPQAVMYDIIFARPSDALSDSLFAGSLNEIENIYLPAGFSLSEGQAKFRWEESVFLDQLRDNFPSRLLGQQKIGLMSAAWAEVQNDRFAGQNIKTGHISAPPDADGIYRHFPLIIKVDSIYFPAVSLAIFLDYIEVPFDSLRIVPGFYVEIPALPESSLEKTMRIPVDDLGRVFIPYFWKWQDTPAMIQAQNLISMAGSEETFGNLLDFIEGNFVFISDISVGASDLGPSPLENDLPLVSIHANLMEAFLTGTFYHQWTAFQYLSVLFILAVIVNIALIFRQTFLLYSGMALTLLAIPVLGYQQFLNNQLFPVISVFIAFSLLITYMIIRLQIITLRDQAFIREAFSKYVPPKFVDQLMENPDLLKLRGEEREITILFSDLKDFTTISERIKPAPLVNLINRYLTAMTEIVIRNDGIIDKYIGDGIMAEFGTPIFYTNHAELAIKAAIEMIAELKKLNALWKKDDLPELICRVGINTGRVISGNLGSDQVFDYTVLGDPVNLAARLEGANKMYGSDILISEFTYERLNPDTFLCRKLDNLKVKGKTEPVLVYQVAGYRNDPALKSLLPLFEVSDEIYDAFQTGKNEIAIGKLASALVIYPDDIQLNLLLNKSKDLL